MIESLHPNEVEVIRKHRNALADRLEANADLYAELSAGSPRTVKLIAWMLRLPPLPLYEIPEP